MSDKCAGIRTFGVASTFLSAVSLISHLSAYSETTLTGMMDYEEGPQTDLPFVNPAQRWRTVSERKTASSGFYLADVNVNHYSSAELLFPRFLSFSEIYVGKSKHHWCVVPMSFQLAWFETSASQTKIQNHFLSSQCHFPRGESLFPALSARQKSNLFLLIPSSYIALFRNLFVWIRSFV